MAWPRKRKRRQRWHSPAQQRGGQARQAAPANSNRSGASHASSQGLLIACEVKLGLLRDGNVALVLARL